MNESTKYNTADTDVNFINSKFISLNEEEKKSTTAFFKEFIEKFVQDMKRNNKLFNDIYQEILHAGSYYDGLKIGKPDEYDLDLIFKLPINYKEIKITTSKGKPGYVKLQVPQQEYKRLLKNQFWSDRYYVMVDWFDKELFFLPDKFRCWLQSVVQNTFNNKKYSQNGSMVTFTTSGPAVTLHIDGNIKFSVDLVPVLKIDHQRPPPAVENIKPGNTLPWYVVPKPFKLAPGNGNGNQNWRLALHEHEKCLISRKDRLKPALRLLKKFRDSQNFPKIASYYLKTICLWEVNKEENEHIWNKASLSYTFVFLLKAFHKALKDQNIPYYWQRDNNLLSVVKKETIENNCSTVKKILDKIEKDPSLIPSFILTKSEYQLFLEQKKLVVCKVDSIQQQQEPMKNCILV